MAYFCSSSSFSFLISCSYDDSKAFWDISLFTDALFLMFLALIGIKNIQALMSIVLSSLYHVKIKISNMRDLLISVPMTQVLI